MADVSVVVVMFNALPWVEQALESVRGHETIVVDNGSTDGTVDLVREKFPEARLIQQGNKGLGGGSNAGMRVAAGDWFLLLNSDAWAIEGALERLVAFGEAHPEAAVVGPKLRFPDALAARDRVPLPAQARAPLACAERVLRQRLRLRPPAGGGVPDGRGAARPPPGRRYGWPLRRGLLHVQRG